MTLQPPQWNINRLLYTFSLILILVPMLCLVVACNVGDKTDASTTSPSPFGGSKVATAEREATEAAIFATRWVQGTRPVVTPFPSVIATAAPVNTPLLGIGFDRFSASNESDFGGGWTGVYNSEYLFVDSVVYKSQDSDPMQGVLLVYTATMDLRIYSEPNAMRRPCVLG
jgi:hypothetical protein